ncbi:MAG: PAS domain-containing protein, partial [Nevskia sp.]|nr:PAS domain-containing protein [Nevskia sp.]
MDGTIRGANEIFLKLLGYSEGELIGRHHDLLSPVDANSTGVSQQFWQALRSGKSQAGQHKMLTKDGREVWLQANYNPVIIGDGQPIRIVVYSTDITKQVLEKSRMVEAVKQMDEALGAASAGNFSKRISCEHLDEDARSLGQGINQFLELLTVREKSTSQLLSETTRIRRGLDVVITNVMIADNDLNIIYANESVRQMLAAAEADIRKDLPAFRADSMLGTNIDSFHKNPAHQRRMLGEMSATHKTRLNLGGRSFSLILNPIFNESGERLGTVVEWRDITEQLAQDARDAAQVEANQALSRAVAEVRTVVAKASTGDLKQRVREDDKEGEIHTLVSGVNQVLASNDALISDITATLGEIGQGRLSVRADAERHQGGFRTMIHDINTSLDAVINPLNVAASYVDRISKGDIPAPITDSDNGDFNAIKNNLNTCISAVNALVADAGMLSTAAVEGKLATRADATKHQGDFRKIVQGVNETLDAVINPLNVAASYVDRISKGDIPAPITDSYNGDFNTIKNNLNQAIDAVNKLVSDAGMLSVAAVEGKLATRADATKHQGDFRKIVQGVNDTLDAVINPLNVAANYVDRISKGDIPAPITDSYNGDFNTIKNNLNQAIDAVNKLVADAGMLSTAAVEGKLATRADASKHQGDFRKIVQGVNETLDAVINPLNVAASYVDQISKGDIPAPITDSYNGDFNTIKNNLNTCISAVNSLVADAGMLSMAAVEGKLATRADATKHQGDFRKIVQGVNDTLDAVIGPLNVAAGYVDRISKGDIPTPITDSYNGDFNAIKNNLNQAISAVNALVMDAGMLSLAAVEGKLATRADATKHQGDFRKIVQGVNETLDAVINPLNVAANYVDRISKGDIPAPITDSYNGDFNTIKNNLNQAIDAVNKLVADAGMLSTAAVEGKLATRADASKHQGDFRRIVQGVNETLDAVINPLNVAANYVDRISKGDIPAPITDSYNGDFNTIKNNLNQAIDAVNKLVADAGMLSTAAVEGKLATRADATKHQGDFRKIVQGVNDTLDAVIGPLNVAAGYVDRISKGDIPTPITDSYNGDFNTIKNNLNQAIEAVNKLVADAGMLSTAAVEGKLATRADASKHQGDFRRIVQGVNETL